MSDEASIKVLLVDDEQTLTEFLAKRLLKEGFMVKATFSGEEAIEAVSDSDYDVAVVDLKMPGMDGVETQKGLKKIQKYLQCIVLTGYGSIESALESGQENAFNFLLKPIDYENLVENIRKAYDRKVELQTEAFQREMEGVHKSGMGAKGIKKAINKLRKIYGID